MLRVTEVLRSSGSRKETRLGSTASLDDGVQLGIAWLHLLPQGGSMFIREWDQERFGLVRLIEADDFHIDLEVNVDDRGEADYHVVKVSDALYYVSRFDPDSYNPDGDIESAYDVSRFSSKDKLIEFIKGLDSGILYSHIADELRRL